MDVRSRRLSAVQKTPSPVSAPEPSAEEIFKSFNTWRFKREQPSDSQAMLNAISIARSNQAPVPFVLYWGKGPRDDLAMPDEQCLDYLNAVGQSVANLYEHGARITLICTDTHAQLNGYSNADSTRYFDAIRGAGARRGFKCVKLSDLIFNHADVVAGTDSDELPPALLPVLSSSAAKWHSGGLSPEAAARKYYAQNMREKRAVETAFPNAIFITFNNSKHRPLFPAKMPIFYMYALKKGIAKKPWFLDENGDDPTFANDQRGSESDRS